MQQRRNPILERWLAQHWLFAGANTYELEPLFGEMRAMRYPAGRLIYRAGDVSDVIYFLTSGIVKVAALDQDGKQVQINVAAPTQFGDMGALDGVPRWGAAIAVDSCTAYIISAGAFRAVLERSSLVGSRMVAQLVKRLAGNRRLGELPATASWELLSAEAYAFRDDGNESEAS
jgi:CRP/FNR family transcriptional regulator, cyclic AMP receptor protein